jgi:spectrin beta
MEVEDLFTDLADGRKLLKLLEIISGEKLGKPNSGKMRVHKVENVNKSLAFLHTKARISSESVTYCGILLHVTYHATVSHANFC